MESSDPSSELDRSPVTPKRPRVDSAPFSTMPASKRTKRSFSDDDQVQSTAEAVSPPVANNLLAKCLPVEADNTLQEPPLEAAQPPLSADSDMDLAKSQPSTVEMPTDRQFSEPASMSSDATLVARSETPSSSLSKAVQADDNTPAVTGRFPAAESPFEKCLVRLPKHVQLSILEHAQLCVPRDQTGKQKVIRPWFKQGMRNDSYFPTLSGDCTEPTSDSMYADLYISQDNQTYLEASLVSRTFADMFIYLFYSTNTFHFKEPRAALWFFKSLGSRFRMIKNVAFSIESGLETYAKNATMTESYEELWYGVVCWIQYRHNFQNLTIRIGHWPSVKRQRQAKAWMGPGSYTVNVDDEVIDEALMFRDKLVHRLCQIRGIRNPILEDLKNKCLSNDEIVQIQLVMKQSAGRRFKAESTIKKLLKVSRERQYIGHNGIPEIKDQMMDMFESLQQGDEEDTTSGDDKQTAKKWWEDPGNYAKDDEDLPALIEATSKDDHRQLPTEWGFDPMDSSTQNRDNGEQTKTKEKEHRRSQENDPATKTYYSTPGPSAYRPHTNVNKPKKDPVAIGDSGLSMSEIGASSFYGNSLSQSFSSLRHGSPVDRRRGNAVRRQRYGRRNHARPGIW